MAFRCACRRFEGSPEFFRPCSAEQVNKDPHRLATPTNSDSSLDSAGPTESAQISSNLGRTLLSSGQSWSASAADVEQILPDKAQGSNLREHLEYAQSVCPEASAAEIRF